MAKDKRTTPRTPTADAQAPGERRVPGRQPADTQIARQTTEAAPASLEANALRAVRALGSALARRTEAERADAIKENGFALLLASERDRDRVLGLLLEAFGLAGAPGSMAASFAHLERAIAADESVSARVRVLVEKGVPEFAPAALAEILSEQPEAIRSPIFLWSLEWLRVHLAEGWAIPQPLQLASEDGLPSKVVVNVGSRGVTFGEWLGFAKRWDGTYPGSRLDPAWDAEAWDRDLGQLQRALGELARPPAGTGGPEGWRDAAARVDFFESFRNAQGRWAYAAFSRLTGIPVREEDRPTFRKNYERARKAARRDSGPVT